MKKAILEGKQIFLRRIWKEIKNVLHKFADLVYFMYQTVIQLDL
jgi:hypothetical protein